MSASTPHYAHSPNSNPSPHSIDCRLVSSFALSKVDRTWSDSLKNSLIVSACRQAVEKFRSCIDKLGATHISTAIGTAAKFLSLLAALILLAGLPLPQFAADKEGLAVLAVCGIALYITSRLLLDSTRDKVLTVGIVEGANGVKSNAVDMLILGILGINLASTFASHYFQASVAGFCKELIYVLSYFWFAAVIATGRKRSITAVSILITSGLATALYGLYQYHAGVAPLATWEDPTIEQQATRIYSTLGNPNLLAGYLTPLAPLAVAVGFISFFKRHYIAGTASFIAALIFGIAILLTGSRGGYIALGAWLAFLIVVIAQYAIKLKRRLSPLYLLLFIAVLAATSVAAIHFLPTLGHRLGSIFAGSEHSSNAFRLNVWRASWRMFLDNWWLGIGPGNKCFILAYGLYMFSGFDALGTYCVPLEVAVETGILGLFLFVGLFLTLMARAHMAFRATNDYLDRWLSLGCAAALWGVTVHGLVDTVFFRPQVQFIFWLLAALIAAIYRRTFASSDSTV